MDGSYFLSAKWRFAKPLLTNSYPPPQTVKKDRWSRLLPQQVGQSLAQGQAPHAPRVSEATHVRGWGHGSAG